MKARSMKRFYVQIFYRTKRGSVCQSQWREAATRGDAIEWVLKKEIDRYKARQLVWIKIELDMPPEVKDV